MSTAAGERSVLLIGGTSEIGLAIVRRLGASAPARVFLLGRDPERLAGVAATLDGGGEYDAVDADALDTHEEAIARAFERGGGFDIVVLAVGVLGGQAGIDANRLVAEEVMRVNFLGAGSLLLASLGALRRQGHGTIVVLSSVAAERARASNAIYGAAKAGLDALAQGLADSLSGTGVRVLVVRPGFVRTRMTASLKPAPFATSAEAVAEAVIRALDGRQHTIWVPQVLRYVFAVLRHLPRPMYRRLPL
ncbi:MAG: SDR family NAD(P)-dependent oxidoreductase [Solirubrobacterales bacterium]|nr:SDR family NAD(P)-dependent oxidoreductase [Solirubrobacterales bacterium]